LFVQSAVQVAAQLPACVSQTIGESHGPHEPPQPSLPQLRPAHCGWQEQRSPLALQLK
jgi:hypothetical protein